MRKILKIALSQQGVKEIPGEADNPIILQYAKDIGHSWVQDDETAWCSIFVNWCALKSGCEMSGKLNARSWLDVGDTIEQGNQLPGDVAIFWRGSKDSWKGHVAIYQYEDDDYYYVLGGNQGNSVKISAYAKSRFLGFRRI